LEGLHAGEADANSAKAARIASGGLTPVEGRTTVVAEMNSTPSDSAPSSTPSARDQLGDDAQKALDAFLLALALMLKGDAQSMIDLLTKLWTPVFTLIDHEGIKAIAERLRAEFHTAEEEEDVDPLGEAKALRDFVREATGSAALSSEDAFKILHMSGFHEDYQIPDPPEHPLARMLARLEELIGQYLAMKLTPCEEPRLRTAARAGAYPAPRSGVVTRPVSPVPRPMPVAYEEQHCLFCLTKRRDHAADGCQRFVEADELPRTSVSPGRTAQAGAVPAVEIDAAMGIQALALLARNGVISPEGQVKPEFWKGIQEMIAAEDAAGPALANTLDNSDTPDSSDEG
jgi:hypothetical protein